MTIRFILEVPRSEAQGALQFIDRLPDAEIVVAHHVDASEGEQSSDEISVIAEDLDIVDEIYGWWHGLDSRPPVFVNTPDGMRCRLSAYDPPSLRHALAVQLRDDAPHPAPPVQYSRSRAGNSVFEVPFGGRMSQGPALVSAENTTITMERVDHIALRVMDLPRAERFYNTFFGMDIVYRAYRQGDRWEQVDETFDWSESIYTGPHPEIARLENGAVALVLIDAGMAQPLYENRVDHVSVVVSPEALAEIRGRALFNSFTIREEGQRAFAFVDPFGLVWQLIAEQGAAIEAGYHGAR